MSKKTVKMVALAAFAVFLLSSGLNFAQVTFAVIPIAIFANGGIKSCLGIALMFFLSTFVITIAFLIFISRVNNPESLAEIRTEVIVINVVLLYGSAFLWFAKIRPMLIEGTFWIVQKLPEMAASAKQQWDNLPD